MSVHFRNQDTGDPNTEAIGGDLTMQYAVASAGHTGTRQGSYRVSLLGTIKSHLEGLQGYKVMALELVQNADDATASSIVFDICRDALYVRNSGKFSRCDDVLASKCPWDTGDANSDTCDFHGITNVASGGKLQHPDNIGRFGIGFVSVYQITDYPEIVSSNVRMTLVPERESFNEADAQDIQGTEFRLPWARDRNSRTRRALSASPITNKDIDDLPDTVARILGESLLFLRHVTRAEVKRDGKLVSSYEVDRDVGTGYLQIDVHPAGQSLGWYVLQADAGERTAQLCNRFPILSDLKRSTKVAVAIPIDQEIEFTGRFFAYLPTEQQHGLSAHINADFFPKPDRKAIVLDGGQHQQAWNAALIECAAATLAGNLVVLCKPLGPARLWKLIKEAYVTAKRTTNGGMYREILVFWKAIEAALAKHPPVAMDTSGAWSPAPELLHTPTKLETDEVSALRRIGVKLIHTCLADYSDILRKAGVSPLDARSLAKALEGVPILEEFRSESSVPEKARRSLLEPLWRVMDKLLAWPKSENRSILSNAPLFLRHDGQLVRFKEGRKRPEKVSLERLTEWFPSLPLPHPGLEEHVGALTLTDEIEPELVVSELKNICRMGGSATLRDKEPEKLRSFYRLLRDLMVGRNREANRQTLSALAALPIFRSGEGFVAAQGAFLPGDFEDPIGVASLLAKEFYDPVTQEFLQTRLYVQKQSLKTYVTTQLPIFFKEPPPIDRYKKLLIVLANHSSSLLDSSSLKETLCKLDMIPVRDGGWSIPSRTYKYTQEIERLLGFGPRWWLDEERLPKTRATDRFLMDLGVRDAPCAEHLVQELKDLTKKNKPTEEVRRRAENLFYVICDNFSRWKEEDGINIKWLNRYKCFPIFPAKGIYHEWFPGNKLYAPFRSAAFASQAKILSFRRTQRLVPKVLDFFGIKPEPTTDLVIAHLRHCVAKGIPVSPLAYQILNEHAKNSPADRPQIKKLQDEPCIWSAEDKTYLKPSRIFWTDPRLGRFGAQVPSQAEKYRQFLDVVGVAEQPPPSQWIGIVRQIAEEYGEGQPLSTDDAAVMQHCLRGIGASLKDQNAELRKDDVSSLRHCPSILNLANSLGYAHEVAVKDSDWHAEPFGSDIAGLLAPDDPDIRPLYEHFGMELVSKVITQTIDQVTGQRSHPEMSSVFSKRALLFVRLLHDQSVSVRKNFLHKLCNLAVEECQVLRAKHIWSLGDNEFTSDARDAMAIFETNGPTLYIRSSGDASRWAEALRSIFHVLLPQVGGHELPKLVFIGKQLIMSKSPEESEADLDDAGIPPLPDTWDSTERPPKSRKLDDFPDVQELPDSGAEEPVPEITRENSGALSGVEITSAEQTGEDADKTAFPPGALHGIEKFGTSGDGRKGRTQTTRTLKRSGNDGKSGSSGSRLGSARPSRSSAQGRSTAAATAQRRNRLRSYVRPRDAAQAHMSGAATDSSSHIHDVEEAARATVCQYEEKRGRKTKQMPPMYPAYDIKSYDQERNVVRLIEVKGIDGEWVDLGVGLKKRQFSEAWDEGDKYWLYVVEFARDPEHTRVYPIQNPAVKVDEFFFDQNWRAVAESAEHDLRTAFQAGTRIRHGTFGEGVIRERNERGLSAELVIDFKNGGAKALPLNLSQLELITDEEELDGDILS